MLRFAVIAILTVFPIALPGEADAAELVMFEQAGCVWCQKWEEEIGLGYGNTEEGKLAPLRRVDIDKPLPADLSGVKLERFTPTFVLVENGEEIARLRGYPGDQFFWFLLDEMLAKLEEKPSG